MMKSVFKRKENIMGKGENAVFLRGFFAFGTNTGYQYFFFFPECFGKTGTLCSKRLNFPKK